MYIKYILKILRISLNMLFIFIALTSLSEWWIIGFKKNYEGYAFGLINENPWFYETPDLYAKVMLIEGLLLTTIISFSIYYEFKKNYKKSNYLLLIFFSLIILQLINGNFF